MSVKTFYHYYVWYETTDRDKTRRKTFKHDGSLLDNQRAFNEAKEFANRQHFARIDHFVHTIEIENAGHGKPSEPPTLKIS